MHVRCAAASRKRRPCPGAPPLRPLPQLCRHLLAKELRSGLRSALLTLTLWARASLWKASAGPVGQSGQSLPPRRLPECAERSVQTWATPAPPERVLRACPGPGAIPTGGRAAGRGGGRLWGSVCGHLHCPHRPVGLVASWDAVLLASPSCDVRASSHPAVARKSTIFAAEPLAGAWALAPQGLALACAHLPSRGVLPRGGVRRHLSRAAESRSPPGLCSVSEGHVHVVVRLVVLTYSPEPWRSGGQCLTCLQTGSAPSSPGQPPTPARLHAAGSGCRLPEALCCARWPCSPHPVSVGRRGGSASPCPAHRQERVPGASWCPLASR